MHRQSVCASLSFAAILLDGALSASAQTTIYVDGSATGANNGSRWCDAYIYLQDALAAATQGGILEIRVAQGTYKPDQGAIQTQGDRNASFQMVRQLTVRGGYAGCSMADPDERDVKTYLTILSGDLAGNDIGFVGNDENSINVIRASASSSVLDGFVVTASSVAIKINSDLTIQNCTIERNSGAGISVDTEGGITVEGCDIRWNAGPGINGGRDSSSFIYRTLVRGNGGSGIIGEFLHAEDSVIAFNVSGGNGGGINWTDNGFSVAVQRSIVFGNAASRGGGIYGNDFSYADFQAIEDSLIWGNQATTGPQIELFGALFGGMCNSRDSLTVTHCDVQGGESQIVSSFCYLLAYNSDNIDADPTFVNPVGVDGIPATDDDDFRLCPGSPAIGMVPSWLRVVECCRDSDCGTADPCDGAKFCGPDRTCGGTITDCNKNGIEDECDVATGASADRNGNRIPDECEPHGDCDGNGSSGLVDYQQFPNCLTGPSAYLTRVECHCFDFGSDGMISIFDFAALQTMFSGQ